jgi:hypothetical protein
MDLTSGILIALSVFVLIMVFQHAADSMAQLGTGKVKVMKAVKAVKAADASDTAQKADAAVPNQLNFQTPATAIMEKIVDLHHDLMFFIIAIGPYVVFLQRQKHCNAPSCIRAPHRARNHLNLHSRGNSNSHCGALIFSALLH